MPQFTLEIKAMTITCVEGRSKGARKFYQGAGVEFYTTGKVAGKEDRCCNIVVNKCIELNIPHRSVRRWA